MNQDTIIGMIDIRDATEKKYAWGSTYYLIAGNLNQTNNVYIARGGIKRPHIRSEGTKRCQQAIACAVRPNKDLHEAVY